MNITFIQLSTNCDHFSLAHFNFIFVCLYVNAGFYLAFHCVFHSETLTLILTKFFVVYFLLSSHTAQNVLSCPFDDFHKLVGWPRGVMVKTMDCRIVVSKFVLQSRYYVHFRAKYPWERYEPLYPPSYGLNSTTTILLGE